MQVFIKTNEACLGYVYVILKTAYFTVTISEKLLQDHLKITFKKSNECSTLLSDREGKIPNWVV